MEFLVPSPGSIDLLYDKFDSAFPSKESKDKWINYVMNDSDTRVLMEIKVEKTFMFEHYEKDTEDTKDSGDKGEKADKTE